MKGSNSGFKALRMANTLEIYSTMSAPDAIALETGIPGSAKRARGLSPALDSGSSAKRHRKVQYFLH